MACYRAESNKNLEILSSESSNITEWQARRTNLRYRDNTDGKVKFVHTLNNTGIATPRALVPFLENHQQADGSIRIPEKLQPYMMGKKFIGGKK